MGQDKALLPHPEGGTWLERQLRLLGGLGAPVSLLSRWPAHLAQATALAAPLAALGVELEPLPEPRDETPGGPLLALGRLMEAHPNARLLLCPIDMPALTFPCLQALLEAARADADAIWIATPEGTAGQPAAQPQPLLGLYPGNARRRQSLREALARGERGLQRWLVGEGAHTVPLPAKALANVNTPQELDAWHATLPQRPRGQGTAADIEHP
jgi:molybdopterin-guanine dinucleotide biosynthesis protein A